jgi:catechol 2,3-dioxygenase-like lactoylglutathione lyase family enzyme
MITELNHYNVRTVDLDRSVRFYRDVLGLSVGPRPNFAFAGAWMYCGKTPVVHIMQRGDGAASYTGAQQSGDLAADRPPPTGRIDHVAFLAEDLPGFKRKLAALGIAVAERQVPNQQIIQLFLDDPDGVRIELNFPSAG